MKSRDVIKLLVSTLVGLALLCYTVTIFGVDNYLKLFSGLSIPILFVCCITVFLDVVFVSIRVCKIFRAAGVKLGFYDSLWINLWGNLVSIFQKGLGLILTIDSISLRTKTSRSDTTSRFSIYYAVDMIVRVFATALGLLVFYPFIPSIYISVFMLFIIGLLVASILVFLAAFGNINIKNLFNTLTAEIPIINGIVKSLTVVNVDKARSTLPFMFFVSCLSWLITGVEWTLISYAVGYPLSFTFCLLSCSVLSLARLTPFIPTGLGVFDTIMALGFGLANLPSTLGLAFAMIDRLDDVIIYSFALIKPSYLRFINNNEGGIIK